MSRAHLLSRPALPVRSVLGIGVLTLAARAGSTGSTLAASVTPIPVGAGNPTCGDFDPSWHQIKLDPPKNGSESDGTVTVTVSNFQQSDAGNPGSFDWTADAPIAAVFVKAGNDMHHLYVYDPAVMGDTDLGPQAGQGNGISHISFCYGDAPEPVDEPEPTPTPDAPEPTPDAPESTATPAPVDEPDPTPTPDVPEPAGGDDPEPVATPEPEGGVEPVTGTPEVTLPPTDALAAATITADEGEGVPMGPVLILGLLAGAAVLGVLLRPARER